MAIFHNLILKTNLESCCGMYVKIAIYYFLKKLYAIWNKDKVLFFLMINVL